MIADWLTYIGENFPPETYLFWTRLEGSIWTLADFVIVFYLLRIGNVLRRYLKHRQHRLSFVLLAATIPFALILPVAPGGQAFFRLELAVTMPHFLLIIYACATDFPIAQQVLARYLARQPQAGKTETFIAD